MSSEIINSASAVVEAVATAGQDAALRSRLLSVLRDAEANASDPAAFRETVRWPLILGLLGDGGVQRIELDNGLVFEVGADSRIDQAVLLSAAEHPDHVWEPQTTKLLTALAVGARNVIVGGAYIGDHVLPMARAILDETPAGRVHAFEPMRRTFGRLCRNVDLNGMSNIETHQLGVWDTTDAALSVEGDLALASAREVADDSSEETVKSVTIDDYVTSKRLDRVGLIMLDTEGGEERALVGASNLLAKPEGEAPNIVFEIHRHFVDWSDGLEHSSVVKMLTDRGYQVFAVRDYHLNYPMQGKPIEIIPIDRVYLEGPPHGFNALATKDGGLIARLGLKVVTDVSPKLLLGRDPALHQPLHEA